jgi:TonB-linked SusC/RagA family outer membrane protein
MRKIASLLSLLMLVVTLAIAQPRTVTGRVLDAQGNPVPFATVTVKGTNTGVAADQSGNFSIQAPPGAVLQVSAAGFQTSELNIGQQASVELRLGTQQGSLQEVVVTAQGVRRTRNQVPYAAQQVSGEEVSKTRTNNFMQNLSGKVSGMEIRQGNTLGGSTNMVIRGTKTISGSNQPLFVIDGIPIDNSNPRSISPVTGLDQQSTGRGGYDYGSAASDINPDDIETITVLKGAAATSLYGSRGGNGVVLITTKQGARGLGITLNTSVGFGKYDKSTFAKYQNEYGGGYGPYYEDPTGFFLYRDPNNGFEAAYDTDADGNIIAWHPEGRLVAPMMEDASYGGRFDPNLMVYQWDAFDPLSPNFGKPRPWVAAANGPGSFFQTAVSSNQSIMVDGGSDKGSFKLGYTRTDDKGILPNSYISKNIASFGGTYNITSKISAGASANFTNVEAKGRYGTGYDDKNLMTNFRQWWQTNVDVKELKEAYFREHKNVTWNWQDPTSLVPIFWDNPYFTRYENFETDGRNRLIGSVYATYNPVRWLNITGRISHDTYDDIREERQAVGSVTTSSYNRTNSRFRQTNFNLIANFDRDLSTDWNLKALLGTNAWKTKHESIYATTNGGLIVERIYALSNSLNAPEAPIERFSEFQTWGNFAGVTLSWQDMVTLDGTIRNDRFSTLPKGNESDLYYSGSLGFVFSKLLPSATWLSYGKLRGNYATVGNGGERAYATADVYAIGTPFGPAPLVSVTASAANPNLKVEQTKSYEFGLEAAFLKNRAGFDVTYYNAKTFDQLFPVPVSTSTGYSSKFLNAGHVRNKGVEVSAFGTPVQTRDFTWNINANWTRNRNKVEELFPGTDAIVLGTFQGGISIVAAKGEPYGMIRGNDFTYIDGQRVINQTTGRPVLSGAANINIGNSNPDWIGGLNNSFRYKNVTFSFLIDTRQGGDLFSLDQYYGLATGLYPETAGLNDLGNPQRAPSSEGGGVILSGVTPDGKPNEKRAINPQFFGIHGYRYQPNKAFIYDASFVKLREAILTYSLPKSLMDRLQPLKGVDVSLIGRNLWIIHKNTKYSDPEEYISAGNLQGYQSGAYPTTRTFTFNLKFRF